MRYSRIEELDIALPKTMFDREAIPYEAGLHKRPAFALIGSKMPARQSGLAAASALTSETTP